MKILIISHGYAPQISPRAFRWTALAEYWVREFGAEIDVITQGTFGSNEFEVLNGVRVFRVGNNLETQMRANSMVAGPKRGGVLFSALRWIYRRTWRQLLWPDYACLWYFAAKRKARELFATSNYTHLISVSHPFTGHLVGHSIKKRNPRLRWMMDIGDPFAFLEGQPPNNLFLFKSLNFAVERKILAATDLISVTTEPTAALYRKLMNVPAAKIHVLPPLFDRTQTPALPNKINSSGKTLVYVGTLYRHIRSPQPLLEIFRQLVRAHPDANYKLHFYGALNECEQIFAAYHDLVGKNIFTHGVVSRAEAQRAVAEADILVNLGNDTTYQLPSKTVEYLASGKPLINLVRSESDSSLAFFSDYPSKITLFANENLDTPATLRSLVEFIDQARPVNPNFVEEKMRNFSLAKVAKDYWELLK